jgi:hypothetical protein
VGASQHHIIGRLKCLSSLSTTTARVKAHELRGKNKAELLSQVRLCFVRRGDIVLAAACVRLSRSDAFLPLLLSLKTTAQGP